MVSGYWLVYLCIHKDYTYICDMQLEDYLYVRKNLELVKAPAHIVSLENGSIFIERNKSPRFKAEVNIKEGKFLIGSVEWIDAIPIGKERIYTNKAFHFLDSYFIIKKFKDHNGNNDNRRSLD